MSVITEAVTQMKSRLAEIEQQIAPLAQEADELRQAIAKLEDIAPAPQAPNTPRRTTRRPTRAKRAQRSSNGRAPRGQNRQRILDAIATEAKTAGQVASETGIGPGTVGTTLTKLVKDGAAVKAPRGYKAA